MKTGVIPTMLGWKNLSKHILAIFSKKHLPVSQRVGVVLIISAQILNTH